MNLKSIYVFLLTQFIFINCEYYKAYQYNEEGIKQLNESKLNDSKDSFHKSISYSYKTYIPTYNIGNTLMQEDDLPSAHEKFQQAIEANPDFKEAIYNDGQVLYLWGKKELAPETCDVKRAKVLFEQAMNRFRETSKLTNAGEYKKPSEENAEFIESEIAKLDELEANGCKEQENENKQNQSNSEGDQSDQQNSSDQLADNQGNPQKNNSGNKSKDKDESKNKDKTGKDGKDSKDKGDNGKDGKDSKDKGDNGKEGKDSKDKGNTGKDGKDSKDKGNTGKDGKDSKDKGDSGKDSENGDIGDNGYLPSDEGLPRNKKSLTPDEQKRISKEMERIQKRSTETKGHRRSRHQQEKTTKNQQELEKELNEALW